MLESSHPVRRHASWPVQWAVLYGNREFVAEGTVLDATHIGWRVAGPMPVHPGMRLNVAARPPEKSDGLRLEATVLWVKDYEFAIEVAAMSQVDREWLACRFDRTPGWWLARHEAKYKHASREDPVIATSSVGSRSSRRLGRRAQWSCTGSPRSDRGW